MNVHGVMEMEDDMDWNWRCVCGHAVFEHGHTDGGLQPCIKCDCTKFHCPNQEKRT